jgi:hypothetical protein
LRSPSCQAIAASFAFASFGFFGYFGAIAYYASIG